jgi:hypothetical protein
MKTFITTSAVIAVASVFANSAAARNDNARTPRLGLENFITEPDRPAHCGRTLWTDPDHAIRLYMRRDCSHHRD